MRVRQLRPLLNGEPNESLTCSPLSWHHPRIRWFLVTNAFKTVLVAISLFVRDPQSQGVAALVIVLMMLVNTNLKLRAQPKKLLSSPILQVQAQNFALA